MSEYYILKGREAVPTDSVEEWARMFEDRTGRRVAATEVAPDISVSTVFLGLDHSFGGGPPELFETLIFGGPDAGEMDRYSTWAEAEAGHERMVAAQRARAAQRRAG